MACLLPGARSIREYWRNILEGVHSIEPVPESRWRIADYFDSNPDAPDKTYSRYGGFIPDVLFDPLEFGLPPNSLHSIDVAQLLSLVVVKAALRDAGCGPDFDHRRTGIILGVSGTTLKLLNGLRARLEYPLWRRVLASSGLHEAHIDRIVEEMGSAYPEWTEDAFPGFLGNVVASRVANRLDFGGPACAVDAACGSSLCAVHFAVSELSSGRASVMIAGGVDTDNSIASYLSFSKTPALSRGEAVRAFDVAADGTLISEGLAMVVLKRLEDAERDQDRIYAVIKGVGTSSDGRMTSIFGPSLDGQERALRAALDEADVDPATVALIEAHATGTASGDAVEVEALRRVYGNSGTGPGSVALGSVKSQIGHMKAAAGAAGLIKAALALHGKALPPTLHVEKPSPALQMEDSPLCINTRLRPWLRRTDGVKRRAAVSSFGFGGTNYHLVLEEYETALPSVPLDIAPRMVLLAAPEPGDLARTARHWHGLLVADGADKACRDLMEASRALVPPPSHARLGFLDHSPADMAAALDAAIIQLERQPAAEDWSLPNGVQYRRRAFAGTEGVVALFPGQGSQYLGMGTRLPIDWPEARRDLEAFDEIFTRAGHPALSQKIHPPPTFTPEDQTSQEAALTHTLFAQGGVGAVSMAAFRILHQAGLHPQFHLGHSFGELTALWAAGAMDDAAYRQLVLARGAALTPPAGVETGTLVAVRADSRVVADCLGGLADVAIANVNASDQVVVGGTTAAVQAAEYRFERAGLPSIRLPVAAAFHTPCVDYARGPWLKALAEAQLAPPRQTVFANATGDVFPADAEQVRDLLGVQPFSPVLFQQSILACHAQGGRIFVEIGPRAILTRLVGAVLGDRPHLAVAVNPGSGGDDATQLRLAVLKLRVAGVALDDLAPMPTSALEPQPGRLAVPINAGSPVFTPRTTITDAPSSVLQPVTPTVSEAPVPAAPSPPPAQELAAEAASSAYALMRRTLELHERYMTMQAERLRVPLELYQRGDAASLAAATSFQQEQSLLLRTHELFLRGQSDQLSAIVALAEGAPPAQPRPQGAPPASTPLPAAVRIPAPEPAVSVPDNGALLIALVSEKTGWPADTLDLGMALEADLGIDSIKRVEILTALRSRVPTAPPVKELAKARTLEDILRQLGEAGAVPTPAAAIPAAQPVSGREADAVGKALIDIVAEKSGYPREFLDLGMNMEADLGIDSIKRVEIVSALRKHLGIAATEAKRLAAARRLEDLVALAVEAAGFPAAAQGPQVAAEVPVPQAGPASVRVSARAVEAVALPPPGARALPQGAIVVIAGDACPAPTLAARLKDRGLVPVVLCPPAGLLPARERLPDDLHQLHLSDTGEEAIHAALARIIQSIGSPDAVVHLQPAHAPAETQRTVLLMALMLAKHSVQPLAARAAQRGLGAFLAVTRIDGMLGTRGDRGTPPMAGGLGGLMRTLALEWPALNARVVDIDPLAPEEEMADRVVAELADDSASQAGVGWRDGTRFTLALRPLPVPTAPVLPASGDVVLVTGGARGITAACALALAERTGCRLVLFGRTPRSSGEPEWARGCADMAALRESHARHALRRSERPHPQQIDAQCRRVLAEREVEANLARLERTASAVRYMAVDIADQAATAAALAEVVREWGPVTGLVHGAGALADSLIVNKSPAQFETVFAPKIDGLAHVLAAVDPSRLRHLAFFSSTASTAGNEGQADYAMANEVLNMTAHALAHKLPSCRVLAFDWGPWQGGMVSADLERRFVERGILPIPLTEGAALFLAELGRDSGAPAQVVVEVAAGEPAGIPAPQPREPSYV